MRRHWRCSWLSGSVELHSCDLTKPSMISQTLTSVGVQCTGRSGRRKHCLHSTEVLKQPPCGLLNSGTYPLVLCPTATLHTKNTNKSKRAAKRRVCSCGRKPTIPGYHKTKRTRSTRKKTITTPSLAAEGSTCEVQKLEGVPMLSLGASGPASVMPDTG